MFPEPLDVVEKIEWMKDKPRKERRQSKFLAKRQREDSEEGPKRRQEHPNTGILLLPAPAAESAIEIARNSTLGRVPRDAAQDSTQLSSVKRRMRGLSIAFRPALVIGYIHALLNAFVLCTVIYIIYWMLYFVTIDVVYKIRSRKEEARAAISEARRLYALNRCDPATCVPALEAQCGEWGHLMRNGLSGIRYTRIAVEVCADVLDGFVSKFSLRSCVVFASLFIAYLIFRR